MSNSNHPVRTTNGKEVGKRKREKYQEKQRLIKQKRSKDGQRTEWIARHSSFVTLLNDGMITKAPGTAKDSNDAIDDLAESLNPYTDLKQGGIERGAQRSPDEVSKNHPTKNPRIFIAEGTETVRLLIQQQHRQLNPYTDLKQGSIGGGAQLPASDEVSKNQHPTKNPRIFIAEGTETVRLLIQQQHRQRQRQHSIGNTSSRACGIEMKSILVKPSTFFEPPVCLLNDVIGPASASATLTLTTNTTGTITHPGTAFTTSGSSVSLPSVPNPPPYKIFIAPEITMSQIAGFHIARGAMACGVVPTRHTLSWLFSSLQQQQQQQQQPHGQRTEWIDRHSSFVTLLNDAMITKAPTAGTETDSNDAISDDLAELLNPYTDLKQGSIGGGAQLPASDEVSKNQHPTKNPRIFIAEGTETVRLLIQQQHRQRQRQHSIGNTSSRACGIEMKSILVKPSTFFEPPVCLLNDVIGPASATLTLTLTSNTTGTVAHPGTASTTSGDSGSLPSVPIPPPYKVFIAPESTMSQIAGFHIARGAMACGVVPTRHTLSWLFSSLQQQQQQQQQPQKRFRIVALDGISDTANLGSLIRTSSAMGIDAIILSDDCCDAWYRRSVRVSMGHVFRVPIVRLESAIAADHGDGGCGNGGSDSGRGMIDVLKRLGETGITTHAAVIDEDAQFRVPIVRLESAAAEHGDGGCGNAGSGSGMIDVLKRLGETGITTHAAVIDEDAQLLETVTVTNINDNNANGIKTHNNNRGWCCVLGNEGNGIRSSVVKACDYRIRIGMAQGVDSLSLPVAAGILLHGLRERETIGQT
eukprot:CAMPEP_0194397252 /NCGR_PEP_ID=MMETSP0174-20130528/125447_1 /TAXON_ID=216777 /ORGANISM="Proboscia alata, Strain PI-D3" /LENGTH=808 /DNA_ID=CAMNT_0039193419 /DNA_START=218 /DNA_END=2644 /DNA_ORIENTATION=+